ncbi:MAG TPA: response regulator, partial [Verrucomicrobiae bacterium]|nr:response regulator [Verrucomicrobiae bacterium]
ETILLVDDSENDLILMRAAFKKAEFNIPLQELHDGEEAIAYLKGEGLYSDRRRFPLPTVMMLDLNMPKLNGFDVLAWVQTQPALKHLSIIILTASMRMEDVEESFDLGAHSFLVKPASMEKLVAMIRCLRDWLQFNHFPPLNESVRR